MKVHKFYMQEEPVKFEEYSEIPKGLPSHLIIYEFILEIQNHTFCIPLIFEDGSDKVLVKKMYDQCISESVYESFKKMSLKQKVNTVFISTETDNGKKMVNFGSDENAYDIHELSSLEEINLSSEITIRVNSLRYTHKTHDDIIVDFELIENDLYKNITTTIFSLHTEHQSHFTSK